MKQKNIIESAELPEQDKIYMKKDRLGWKIVHPIKNPDGSINWLNLIIGGKRNFVRLLIVLIFVLGFFYVYYHDTVEMQKVVADPCYYCTQLSQGGVQPIFPGETNFNLSINLSEVKYGGG